MGLEILEDAPDVSAVIASIGGGGLIAGVASAIKALQPEVKIFALNRRPQHQQRFRSKKVRRKNFETGNRHSWMALAVKACSLACGNA